MNASLIGLGTTARFLSGSATQSVYLATAMVPLMEIVTNVLRMHPGTGMDTVFEKIYGEDLTAMSFRGHVM